MITVKVVDNDTTKRDFINIGEKLSGAVERDLPKIGTCFIAYDNNEPIARCQTQLQTGSTTIGTIGYFQAHDNQAAVKALLEKAVANLREQSVEKIIGPMNGDTWHNYRFNLGPYEQPPFFKEPWNPPYYPKLWLNSGFDEIDSYDSHLVTSSELAAKNQEKFYNRCLRNGFTFEPIQPQNFETTIPTIYELSCKIFSGNKFYTKTSFDEFRKMYLPAKPLITKGLSWIATDSDGKLSGYIFSFPNYSEALKSMNGKNNLVAKLKFLINKHKAKTTCLKTLGVTPEHRGSGLTAALTYLVYKNSYELGYKQTYMCMMHSDNDSRRFSGDQHTTFREYALYGYKNL